MNPLPINPIPLVYARDFQELLFDDVSVFNRLLAMTNSRITGFFYGMPDAFEELSRELDLCVSELTHMGFGEVAALVDHLCENEGVQGCANDGRKALAAFVEPLMHLSLYSEGLEPPIPQSQWIKIRCEQSGLPHRLPKMTRENMIVSDYFGDHLVSRKNRCPEYRLLRSFSFTAQEYVAAVDRVLDEEGLLERTIAPFKGDYFCFLPFVCKLARICKGCSESFTFTLDDDITIDATPDNREIAAAYAALRLLFVRPFALMYSDSDNAVFCSFTSTEDGISSKER